MQDSEVTISVLDLGTSGKNWKRRYIQQLEKSKSNQMFFGINLTKLRKEETEKKLLFLIRFYASDRHITPDQALIIIRSKLKVE